MLDRREMLQGLAALTVTSFIPKVDIKESSDNLYVEYSYEFSPDEISNYFFLRKDKSTSLKNYPFVTIPIYERYCTTSTPNYIEIIRLSDCGMVRLGYLETIKMLKKAKKLHSLIKVECPKLNLLGYSFFDGEYFPLNDFSPVQKNLKFVCFNGY